MQKRASALITAAAIPGALAGFVGALHGYAQPPPVISAEQRFEVALRASEPSADSHELHRHELAPFGLAPVPTAPMQFIATDPQQPPDVGSTLFPAVRGL